jgi:hypothetical protein
MYCKGCHSKIYEDWKKSMHSYALVDPVFQYSFERAEQTLRSLGTSVKVPFPGQDSTANTVLLSADSRG